MKKKWMYFNLFFISCKINKVVVNKWMDLEWNFNLRYWNWKKKNRNKILINYFLVNKLKWNEKDFILKIKMWGKGLW